MKKGKKVVTPDSKNGCDICLSNKVIIGAIEPVFIKGKRFLARVDTGATKNSISKAIVREFGLGPVVDNVEVRNTLGKTSRDVIWVEVEIAGVRMKTKFNVSDRSRMKYPLLIGRNLLKRGFLVDCSNESRDS